MRNLVAPERPDKFGERLQVALPMQIIPQDHPVVGVKLGQLAS